MAHRSLNSLAGFRHRAPTASLSAANTQIIKDMLAQNDISKFQNIFMNFFRMQGISDHRSKELHKRHVFGGSLPYVAPITRALYASVFTSTIHTLLENETVMSICCDFVQHGVVVGNTAQVK